MATATCSARRFLFVLYESEDIFLKKNAEFLEKNECLRTHPAWPTLHLAPLIRRYLSLTL